MSVRYREEPFAWRGWSGAAYQKTLGVSDTETGMVGSSDPVLRNGGARRGLAALARAACFERVERKRAADTLE